MKFFSAPKLKPIAEEEHVMQLLLKIINKATEKEAPMSSWIDQNAKTLKKKEDFFIDKLRLMSIVEGDLQLIFRIIMKHGLHELMEKKNLS